MKLEDPSNGDIFAVCPVSDTSVEPVNDSSRYFVLRIEDGSGAHEAVNRIHEITLTIQEDTLSLEWASLSEVKLLILQLLCRIIKGI